MGLPLNQAVQVCLTLGFDDFQFRAHFAQKNVLHLRCGEVNGQAGRGIGENLLGGHALLGVGQNIAQDGRDHRDKPGAFLGGGVLALGVDGFLGFRRDGARLGKLLNHLVQNVKNLLNLGGSGVGGGSGVDVTGDSQSVLLGHHDVFPF